MSAYGWPTTFGRPMAASIFPDSREETRAMSETLKAGTLAYLDTFSGLVPVKVLRVFTVNDPYVALPRTMAEVRVTADRRAYSRGEILTEETRDLVQRRTRVRNYHVMVRSFDAVEVTP